MKINNLHLWKTISTSKLKLKVIREWGAGMKTSKFEPNKSAIDTEIKDDISVENNEKEGIDRRLQDKLSKEHPKRKMNLDRRTIGSGRRVDADSHYKGVARRYTIDRRLNLKERRDNC